MSVSRMRGVAYHSLILPVIVCVTCCWTTVCVADRRPLISHLALQGYTQPNAAAQAAARASANAAPLGRRRLFVRGFLRLKDMDLRTLCEKYGKVCMCLCMHGCMCMCMRLCMSLCICLRTSVFTHVALNLAVRSRTGKVLPPLRCSRSSACDLLFIPTD